MMKKNIQSCIFDFIMSIILQLQRTYVCFKQWYVFAGAEINGIRFEFATIVIANTIHSGVNVKQTCQIKDLETMCCP